MVAFHYPPARVSSGVQRTLKFSRYLLDHGWQAHVLSADVRAYENQCVGQVDEIPAAVKVKRAFALDTAKHLSIKGKYMLTMALPDRWVSWCFSGVCSGLLIIKKSKPKVIWSTYPIASAHLIAYLLHRLSGIPWIADFRDPMWDEVHPAPGLKRKLYQAIEKKVVKYCHYAVLTTPSAVALYRRRYPGLPVSKWILIANGYDEENFIKAANSIEYKQGKQAKDSSKLFLVHSGLLYPSERDPSAFFKAVAALKVQGVLSHNNCQIILRATGHDDFYLSIINAEGIEDIVCLAPSIPYQEALVEMLLADGLLLFQAANCNHQIPAKAYEYLRAKRPVFAMTDIKGDTADLLNHSNLSNIVDLTNKHEITVQLSVFLCQIRAGNSDISSDEFISTHSRECRSSQLVDLLALAIMQDESLLT